MSTNGWKRGEVKYLHLNGEIVPHEKAVVHITTPAFRYGAMVFEGLRGYWNEEQSQLYLFRVSEHCRRLNQSMKVTRMAMEVPDAEMKKHLIELVRKNDIRETVHFIYSAYVGGEGPPSSTGPIGTAIELRRIRRMFDVQNGIRCAISSWRRSPDEATPMRVKAAANYQNSRYAILQAKQDGYDNAIILTDHGKVSEGPGACLFMVRDGRLITPTVNNDILESITRHTIMILHEEHLGEQALERPIDRSELYIADELFFCGSGYEIVPIVNVDGFPIADGKPGEMTKKLTQLYLDVAAGRTEDHADWRTPVYE